MTQNHHICLISDQILANYIPILMERPNCIHLISTQGMVNKGITKRFENILKQEGIDYKRYNNMPDANISSIQEYALGLFDQIKANANNADLTLNITGGNKLMMLGLYDMFKGDMQRIIYTDTYNSVIESMLDKQLMPLTSVLNIPRYLQAQGVKYLRASSDSESWLARANQRKAISKYFAQHAVPLSNFIGMLNGLAHAAIKKVDKKEVLVQPEQTLNAHPGGQWRDALKMLHDAELLDWQGGKDITFIDLEKTQYLNGFWLEEYVYHIAADAQPDHVACGVNINWDRGKSRNELDTIIVHNNRMLVIECKTLRLGRDEQKDSDIVYKVSDLGDDLRGLFGATWLISAREPDEHITARAKSRGITIIAPSALKTLRTQIQNWMIQH